MAQLFKKNILKEKLETFQIPDLEDKIKTLESWNNLYKEGKLHEKKETSIQWEFASHILGSVLWYDDFVENNNEWNRQNEPWSPTWGQSADYGLWYFKSSKDFTKNKVNAVVEVKDTKTSLDKPQKREWNLTPVQQAFKYKPFFKECDFILVSNFYETRLYIDSYYDYESFTLSDLVNPKDNYFNFRKFYYLLSKQNLLSKRWDSNTKSLLSLIRTKEKEITKQFYKEYTQLRKELFKDIVSNNSVKKTELDFILWKTQKIIDRIIFIHFCEDLDLLPNGKLKENILRAEEIGFTPWEMLTKFFEFVNSWSEKLGIPDGYNGGLFHSDEKLNNLKVWNEICKKFVDMWDYDFADDLSVNILGHIFEQSISDIEELKDKINKEEEVTLSKRKKDWVFYTPEYIVDYIVKNSVGKKIDEWEEELKQKHNLSEKITDKNYEKRAILVYSELQEKVQKITVLDPACGSGAFLVKVFDFLLDKNKEISKKLEDLWVNQGFMALESHFKSILQNNIYWVDLNDESVEITKLSLWLKTAQKGKKLANLDGNIKCGNSLIDDPEVGGDKAFAWETEFKEIFADGGFDVIVGNPPYVPAEWIDNLSKSYLDKKFESAEWRINLYVIFYELGLKLLKKGGFLWYITPYTLLKNKYYFHLRKYILNNTMIRELIDFQNFKIFEDAVVDSIVLIIEKNITQNYNFSFISDVNSFQTWKYHSEQLSIKDILKLDDLSFVINHNLINYDNIKKWSIKISEIINFKQWIITWWNSKFITKIEQENTKKVITWSNFNRYSLSHDGDYIIYDKKTLHRARTPDIFEQNEKILIRQTGSYPIAMIDENQYYTLDTVHNWLIINKNFSLKYLLSILNSSLIKYLYTTNINEWGKVFAQVKIIYINELFVKNISLSEQQPFIEKADFMLENNKILQDKINKFLKRLNGSFEIEKLSKKLEAFYELEFADFVKELKKKKVVLSLKDQDEWEEYFDSYKKEVLELKEKIDSCDKEIDEMVFDLYGLSEEEREVVLGS